MSKQTTVMFSVILCVVVISVTVAVVMGREPTELIMFLSSTVVPAAVALWAGNQAGKAATNAEQAVHNTNGRMAELIRIIQERGGQVETEKYADVIETGSARE